MNTLNLYQLNTDPFSSTNVTVTNAFTVAITDNDNFLEKLDSDGSAQLDLSGVPGISGSNSFQVFESYSGMVGGALVEFTLLQWSGAVFIVLNSGSVSVGDVITGTQNGFRPDTPAPDFSTLPGFMCFVSGTLIQTPIGQRSIEDLRQGDLVILANGDVKPISWIGKSSISEAELNLSPHLRPVRLQANSLGENRPAADVFLSQQHRVAVTAPEMEILLGHSVMLASAKSLINDVDIRQETKTPSVEYFHLLFDQHEILNVNGLMCETFFPGSTSLEAMSDVAKNELYALFPEFGRELEGYGSTVFPVITPFEVQILRKSLVSPGADDLRNLQRSNAYMVAV